MVLPPTKQLSALKLPRQKPTRSVRRGTVSLRGFGELQGDGFEILDLGQSIVSPTTRGTLG